MRGLGVCGDPPLDEAVRAVTNEEDARREIQESVARKESPRLTGVTFASRSIVTHWPPRNDIYGAQPDWLDDPLLAETFTPAEIKALENPPTPRDAPQAWRTVPCRAVCGNSKRWAFGSYSGPTRARVCHGSMTRRRRITAGARTLKWRAWSRPVSRRARSLPRPRATPRTRSIGHGVAWQERRLPRTRCEPA